MRELADMSITQAITVKNEILRNIGLLSFP